MSNNRIKGSQLRDLYVLLDEVVEREGVDKLRGYKEQLKSDERVKDLDMRFRWDILWAARPAQRDEWFTQLYASGGHDSHVDTALRGWLDKQSF